MGGVREERTKEGGRRCKEHQGWVVMPQGSRESWFYIYLSCIQYWLGYANTYTHTHCTNTWNYFICSDNVPHKNKNVI